MTETDTVPQTSHESAPAPGAVPPGPPPPARARPRRRRLLAWGAVALVVAGALLLWLRHDGGPAVKYRTEAARTGDLDVTVTATGNLQPTNQVDVGSELSGIVQRVEVDFNDRVKVGQVLARLDPTKLSAQVLQSRAALKVAQARVLQARATVTEARSEMARLDHVRELSGGRLPSQHDLDAAKASLARAEADAASAEAQVAQARATLEGNETDLKKLVIVSPVDGIVLNRQVEPGQTVAASLQAPVLFTLAEDLAHMELLVDVDEADVGQVREGQEATFGVDAYPERTFSARVAQVRFGSETVAGVVTYKAVLNVDNADLTLRPGMTATADIQVKHVAGALLVPNAALRFTPPVTGPQAGQDRRSLLMRLFPRPPRRGAQPGEAGGKRQARVWVLEDGQPKAVPVTPGATDGSVTEIVKGDLKAGAELVVDTYTPSR
jgi:HlyD family secretion protein